MSEVYFFGCRGERGKDQAGHYMYSNPPARDLEERRRVSVLTYSNPWSTHIDGGLAPKGIAEKQGVATIQQKDGWTLVSYWDRSGPDTRGACNSNFLAHGLYSWDEMLALARENFPDVLNRLERPLERFGAATPSAQGGGGV